MPPFESTDAMQPDHVEAEKRNGVAHVPSSTPRGTISWVRAGAWAALLGFCALIAEYNSKLFNPQPMQRTEAVAKETPGRPKDFNALPDGNILGVPFVITNSKTGELVEMKILQDGPYLVFEVSGYRLASEGMDMTHLIKDVQKQGKWIVGTLPSLSDSSLSLCPQDCCIRIMDGMRARKDDETTVIAFIPYSLSLQDPMLNLLPNSVIPRDGTKVSLAIRNQGIARAAAGVEE